MPFAYLKVAASSTSSEVVHFPYAEWSNVVKGMAKTTTCPDAQTLQLTAKDGGKKASLQCQVGADGQRILQFPAGAFEIDEQLLVPEKVAIVGANDPNPNWKKPTQNPDWTQQTLFLATRGVDNYLDPYCLAQDQVSTRVGFVLSSDTSVKNVAYQGIDTLRPEDNGWLCGGGAFETKGCATPTCDDENKGANNVNNAGSDGLGSQNVTIENVRLNGFYYEDDKAKIGVKIPGNDQCTYNNFKETCCFCKPNGVRSTQLAVWVPLTRDVFANTPDTATRKTGTRNITIRNLVSMSGQADGINLHGKVIGAIVDNTYIQNTGDDSYALWGATYNPENILFNNVSAYNPGIMRPGWYGNCVAFYGAKSATFSNVTCRAPTITNPLLQAVAKGQTPWFDAINTTAISFNTSFGAGYPDGNQIQITKGLVFTDLDGKPYDLQNAAAKAGDPKSMIWQPTEANGTAKCPVYFPRADKDTPVDLQKVGIHVTCNADVNPQSSGNSHSCCIVGVVLGSVLGVLLLVLLVAAVFFFCMRRSGGKKSSQLDDDDVSDLPSDYEEIASPASESSLEGPNKNIEC